MRKIIYISLLFSSFAFAAPLTWPKEAIAQIHSAKTIQELVCPGQNTDNGRELCKLYGSYLKDKMTIKIEQLNDSTVSISSKTLLVQVLRTESQAEFVVNGSTIDLNEFKTQTQLRDAIDKALPKSSAQWPAILDSANAAEFTNEIDAAIHKLLLITVERRNCDLYEDLADSCMGDSDKFLSYLKSSSDQYQGSKSNQRKDEIESKLNRLELKISAINGALVTNQLNARDCRCPATSKKPVCKRTVLLGTNMEQELAKCDLKLKEVRRATDVTAMSKARADKLFMDIDKNIKEILNHRVVPPPDVPVQGTGEIGK